MQGGAVACTALHWDGLGTIQPIEAGELCRVVNQIDAFKVFAVAKMYLYGLADGGLVRLGVKPDLMGGE